MTGLWLDGEIVADARQSMSLWNHSLHYGFGAFEGIRAYGSRAGQSRAFGVVEHIDRLWRTCATIRLRPNIPKAALVEGVELLLERRAHDESYIRPIIFMGDGLGALRDPREVHSAILIWEWKTSEENGRPISLGVSPYRRPDPGGYPSYVKATGNYLLSKSATLWAVDNGFDDAILLDHEGYVSEASAQNLFVVSGGRISTPPVDRCLDGITRKTVISLASDHGIDVSERNIDPREFSDADEVFLTSTASEVLAVASIDGMSLPAAPGPMTSVLREAYRGLVLEGRR